MREWYNPGLCSSRMFTLFTYFLFFLLVLLLTPVVYASVAAPNYDAWVRPDDDYCRDGVCNGSLTVPGNFSVGGDFVNFTYVQLNTTNITADYIRTNFLFGLEGVGIGTTEPSHKLHVKGNTSTDLLNTSVITMSKTSNESGVIFIDNKPFFHSYGVKNAFIGENAGNFYLDQTEDDGGTNVGIGVNALSNLTTGSRNVAIGNLAGENVEHGRANVYIGHRAGRSFIGSGGASLGENIGIGNFAGGRQTGGNRNIFIGSEAGLGITDQSSLIGIGFQTMTNDNAGAGSVAIGNKALRDADASTVRNVAIGEEAGMLLDGTGDYNTFLGFQVANSRANYIYSTLLGAEADTTVSGLSNVIALGAYSHPAASGTAMIGSTIDSTGGDRRVKLAIGGTDTANSSIHIQADDNNKTITLEGLSSGKTQYEKLSIDGDRQFYTEYDYLIMTFQDATGNIGLNMTTPHATLHVNGSGIFEENVMLNSELNIIHVAEEEDDHALEIDINAMALGDVKAIDIDYITGEITTGQDEGIILLNIDRLLSTGGEIFGLEVLGTEGTGEIYGMKVGAEIGVIHQDSGIFVNPDIATNNTVNTNVTAMIDENVSTLTTIFRADNDYIIIGAYSAFEELEIILNTTASINIKPTFWYSTTGASQYTQFTPVDGTNGFRNTGIIAWDDSDLVGHTINDDTGTYDIKIIRTKNNIVTEPKLAYVKIASTTEYIWDESGNVNINNLTVTEQVGIGTINPTKELDVNGEITCEEMNVDDKVEHNGDTNTYLLLSTDSIELYAGGETMIDCNEGATDECFIGDASSSVELEIYDGSMCIGNGGCAIPAGDGNLLVEGSIESGTTIISGSTLTATGLLVGSAGTKISLLELSVPDTQVIADDLVPASVPDLDIFPTSAVMTVDCQDPDGCTLTLDEGAGRTSGELLEIYAIGANALTFNEVGGVNEMAGNFVMDVNDAITLRYIVNTWIENGRSNN